MRELSGQYPRYGYRRIRIFLGRDGHLMSVGRDCRLWQAAGLQVPRKQPRRRVGLSDILCMRPVSSLADEALAEDDGELGFGLEPLSGRPFPILGRVVEDEV